MRTWTTGQYLLLLLLSCLNGPVAIGKICRLALVVDDGRGAAPSDEVDPVEAPLEDPDGGRVSTGKTHGGGSIKEGKSLSTSSGVSQNFIAASLFSLQDNLARLAASVRDDIFSF